MHLGTRFGNPVSVLYCNKNSSYRRSSEQIALKLHNWEGWIEKLMLPSERMVMSVCFDNPNFFGQFLCRHPCWQKSPSVLKELTLLGWFSPSDKNQLYHTPDIQIDLESEPLDWLLNVWCPFYTPAKKFARVISRTRKREHISPVLRSLHSLPVEKRIHYKLLTTAHKVVQGTVPVYLSELVKFQSGARQTRSNADSFHKQ
jgi:hypothetical protein